MTANDFRKIALSQPEAVESEHMAHPDFRVGGKIFATLGYPDAQHAVVMLPPDEQAQFVAAQPQVFAVVNGAWGRSGATQLDLRAADVKAVANAMSLAWQKRAPARLRRQFDRT